MKLGEVAFYARVSSEQQTTAQTIRSQVAALRQRIAEDGLVLLPEHEFVDEGYSGATLLRPALERLRDLVATGVLDESVNIRGQTGMLPSFGINAVTWETVRTGGTPAYVPCEQNSA